jgi:hypothetical protein
VRKNSRNEVIIHLKNPRIKTAVDYTGLFYTVLASEFNFSFMLELYNFENEKIG